MPIFMNVFAYYGVADAKHNQSDYNESNGGEDNKKE